MPVIINGSTGISGTDGSAATPAVQGTDTNTGMFFPAADQIAFAEGGTEVMRIDANGRVGIGTSSPSFLLTVNGQASLNQIILPGTTNYVTAPAAGSAIVFQTVGLDRVAITDTGLLQFNSGYGSVATAFGCRAWVNFNGTGTVAIRASGNVSSITDGGVGIYTVNYATALPDQSSAPVAFATDDGLSNRGVNLQGTNAGNNLTTSCQLTIWERGGSGPADSSGVYVAVFR